MPPSPADPADSTARLTAEIASSAKYRGLARETIEDVVAQELRAVGSLQQARPRARKRLHEVAALYLGAPKLSAAKRTLDEAFASQSSAAIHDACRALLSLHASTRERLAVLDELYRGIFEHTGPPRVVADLAAALGPLGLRFMGLPAGARYLAYDIQHDFVDLIAYYFRLEKMDGTVEQRDVLVRPPQERADVALLLKMYHCLEKRRSGAGLQVIRNACARDVVVSLPARTMGGRRAPFVDSYFDDIKRAADAAGWSVLSDSAADECYLIVRKPQVAGATDISP